MTEPKWTLDAYIEHNEAMRVADQRFQDERDRRYTEVKAAEAEALRIKEAADARALELAREIQDYKDEKANELREQIASERGIYVTKDEMKPIADYVTSQQGRQLGQSSLLEGGRGVLILLASIAGSVITYFATRPSP
jgi:hypothetical protein